MTLGAPNAKESLIPKLEPKSVGEGNGGETEETHSVATLFRLSRASCTWMTAPQARRKNAENFIPLTYAHMAAPMTVLKN